MKLKTCGMKYADNIREVAKLSPDFMGFIFYKDSKRFVGHDFVVPEISSAIKKVGVFVLGVGYFNNPKYDGVEIVMKEVKKHKLDYAQLHSDEVPEFCKDLSSQVKIIKAFGIDEDFDFDRLKAYEPYCEYFLFDTRSHGYGGTGKKFDWKILDRYKGKTPFFLSGGIDSAETGNTNPFAIDVNSKFEIEPGLKDIHKLKKLKDELSGK